MKMTSPLFTDGSRLSASCAFCLPDTARHVRLGENRQPPLFWQEAPAGTASFALICVDPDAPVDVSRANQPDCQIPADAPRSEFFHWIVYDLPAHLNAIEAGTFPSQVVRHGDAAPPAPWGARQGINDFTEGTTGDHYGYDGACPPWNDERPHRYQFQLFALSVPQLPFAGRPEGRALLAAMQPYLCAQTCLTGIYCLNPHLGL